MDPIERLSSMQESETSKEEDDGGHTGVWWWINAARYAVAALVTVLTVAVIARAIAVSLRSEKLYLSVLNGSVSARTSKSPPPGVVTLSLTLRAYNPSGRAGVHYNDINISLLYQNNSPITWFKMESIVVPPEMVQDKTGNLTVGSTSNFSVGSDVPLDFFRRIHRVGVIRNATVHLNGTLQTQISGFNYTLGHATEYRCSLR